MKRSVFLAALGAAPTLTALALPAQKSVFERLVLPVRITYQLYDEQRPWVKLEPGSRTVTGVVVKGKRVLISAQSIRGATDIAVQKRDASWAPAHVAHADHDINLALLAVTEPGFFAKRRTARIATAVPTSGSVNAYYWQNREIEVYSPTAYGMQVRTNPAGKRHGFLMLTSGTDAWSQPVFSTFWGQLVGLVVWTEGDYAGAIPAEILRRYVEMATSGKPYAGFAGLDPYWQFNSHPAQARYLRGRTRGIVLTVIPSDSSLSIGLRPRDVLLTLDGKAIGSDGFFGDKRYGRLKFHALADRREVGATLKASVLRDGRELEVNVQLKRWRGSDGLIPWRRNADAPPFAIRGGLVFRELDGDYLRSFGNAWRYRAPSYLTALYEKEKRNQSADRRRIVLLASVLPDGYNIGYHDLRPHPVKAVNGRRIDGIGDVIDAFEHPDGEFHIVVLEPGAERSEVVLSAGSFAKAHARILATYAIPVSQRVER